jgi:polysaccharide export outer membrane protein
MATEVTRRLGAVATVLVLTATLAAQTASKISPKDQLKITVVGGVDLGATQFVVDTEGAIDYPFLGKVKVQGMTTSEVAARLAQDLVKAQVLVGSPQLTVELQQTLSKNVSVSGAVASKGEVPFSGELSVYNALLKAGGALPEAGDEVQIIRAPRPGRPTSMLSLSRHKIEAGDFNDNVLLEDGDRVIVLEAKPVFIGGQVNRPGSISVRPGMTLRQALLLAGDVTQFGAANRIEIVRNGKKLQRKDIDLDKTIIQPGDTITVPKKRV